MRAQGPVGERRRALLRGMRGMRVAARRGQAACAGTAMAAARGGLFAGSWRGRAVSTRKLAKIDGLTMLRATAAAAARAKPQVGDGRLRSRERSGTREPLFSPEFCRQTANSGQFSREICADVARARRRRVRMCVSPGAAPGVSSGGCGFLVRPWRRGCARRRLPLYLGVTSSSASNGYGRRHVPNLVRSGRKQP